MTAINPYISKAWELLNAGNAGRAKRIATRVLNSTPGLPEAHDLLGSIEMQRGNYDGALEHFEKAAEVQKEDAELYCKLGFCHRGLRAPDKSRQAFKKALDLDKENFNALFALAGICVTEGDLETAQSYLEKSINKLPPNLEPYRLLATLTPKKKDKGFLKALKEVREKVTDYSAENKAHLDFAIASAALAQNQADDFQSHIKTANEYLTPDPSAWYPANKMAFDLSKEVFKPEVFLNNTPKSKKKFTPIFIVGLPRSGSTLLEQILASHAKVHGADELPFVRRLFVEDMTRHYELVYPKFFNIMTQEDKAALAGQYQDKVLAIAPKKPFIVDKMVGNSFFIGAIRILLPWAKVIHIKRHPADTALSMYSSYFDASIPYANDLPELARYFRLHSEYMDLWANQCPGFVLDVKYEDLVEDLEGQSRKILEFCGLEWDPACLDFHKTKRQVGTLSAGQVRNKIYSSSIGKWKKHKDLLKPFLDGVDDLLARYGY